MTEHHYPTPEELAPGRTVRAAAAVAAWMEAGDREADLLDAVQDLITDLGHLFDRCPDEGKGTYAALVAVALFALEEERLDRL